MIRCLLRTDYVKPSVLALLLAVVVSWDTRVIHCTRYNKYFFSPDSIFLLSIGSLSLISASSPFLPGVDWLRHRRPLISWSSGVRCWRRGPNARRETRVDCACTQGAARRAQRAASQLHEAGLVEDMGKSCERVVYDAMLLCVDLLDQNWQHTLLVVRWHH